MHKTRTSSPWEQTADSNKRQVRARKAPKFQSPALKTAKIQIQNYTKHTQRSENRKKSSKRWGKTLLFIGRWPIDTTDARRVLAILDRETRFWASQSVGPICCGCEGRGLAKWAGSENSVFHHLNYAYYFTIDKAGYLIGEKKLYTHNRFCLFWSLSREFYTLT